MSIFLLTFNDEISEQSAPDSLADFLSELPSAPVGNASRIAARVRTTNEVEIPVMRFNFRAPAQSLGCALDVTLARAMDYEVNEKLNFDIGIYDFNAQSWQWINLISGGVIAGRESSLAWGDGAPRDAYNLSIVDALADRWQRAPSVPEIYFDSQRTQVEVGSELYDESGFKLQPLKIAIAGLSLYTALDAAYRAGCGFARVKTNIPNFSIERVDFTLDGGYHAGVAGYVAPFEPVFFATENNELWILDGGARLPNGFTPRDVSVSAIESLSVSQQDAANINRLIVTYQDTTASDYYTERLEQERRENGRFGDSNYTETTTTRRIREYRNQADPTRIIRESQSSLTTEVRAGFTGALTHRETQDDRYSATGRKSGHTRVVDSLVPSLPSGDMQLLTVNREEQSIAYAAHPFRAGETIQESVTTALRGMIHVDNDNQYREQPFKLPFTDAHRNGVIDPEADQSSEFGAIRTTVERVRVRSESEVEMQSVVVDHIAGTTERSNSTPRTGDVGLSSQSNRNARAVVLYSANQTNHHTRAETFNAGSVPGNVAVELGRRKLSDNARRSLRASLARLDLGLRRGVVIRTTERTGASVGTFVVQGFQISGESSANGLTIKQSIEAREVLP